MQPRADGRVGVAAALVSLALAVAGCGDDGGGAAIDVFAAASLTDAFSEVAAAFEAEVGVDVQLNLAGSSALREQILGGAPAEVFASADAANVDAVVEAGLADERAVFATNRLVVAVPAGNPGGVGGLRDFADGDLLLGLCADAVPCGRLARTALDDAGIEPAVDTVAPDVRGLLTQLASGDLDAGIVYGTDVLAAGGAVESIDIEPPALAEYAITALADGDAAAFVAFVLSDAGQTILAAHGFGPA